MKVVNELHVYEVDGNDVPVSEKMTVTVESHWNQDELVVIGVCGRTVALLGRELITAARNAQNAQ